MVSEWAEDQKQYVRSRLFLERIDNPPSFWERVVKAAENIAWPTKASDIIELIFMIDSVRVGGREHGLIASVF